MNEFDQLMADDDLFFAKRRDRSYRARLTHRCEIERRILRLGAIDFSPVQKPHVSAVFKSANDGSVRQRLIWPLDDDNCDDEFFLLLEEDKCRDLFLQIRARLFASADYPQNDIYLWTNGRASGEISLRISANRRERRRWKADARKH